MTDFEINTIALSLGIAALAVAICLAPAVVMASWMGRRGYRVRWVLDALLLLPMVMSPGVLVWAALALPGRHGDGQAGERGWHLALLPEGLVLGAAALVLPLMIRTMRPAFETVDHTLVLTARTLGATRWDAWWSITAAQSGPMVLSASALGFAAAWGQCGAMLVLMGALQPHDGQPGSSALAVLRTGTVGQDLAWRLILASVAVAVAAMLTSEWARQRWRRRALPPRARGIAT